MKRILFASLALMLLLGAGAAADVPPVVWWYDGFDYVVANGTPVANTDGWDGDTTGNLLYSGQVRMSANAGQQGQVYPVNGCSPNPGDIQIFHMSVRGGLFNPDSGNFAEIYMSSDSADIAWWYGWSDRLQPRYDGGAGNQPGQYADLSDGLLHDLDIWYDPTTGLTQWFADGNLLYSANQATGQYVDRAYVWSRYNRGVADIVWIDEMAMGTTAVPEPGSLLAMSVFGVGMIGYIKRRRA